MRPEIARTEHDHVAIRHVVLGALLAGRSTRRLRDGEAGHRRLLVATHEVVHLAARQGAFNELVQAVAVALLEGRALGLAVVGEHDDLIRPRGVGARPLDAPELLVELSQRLHRVRALEPGVVCHLVVARKGRVHGWTAAHHVGQHAEDDQVAHDHGHGAAQQWIDAAPVTARTHIAPAGSQCRGHLKRDLPEEQDQRASDIEAVCEESAVAGIGSLLLLHAADGEDDLLCLAGEQVAAARPAISQEPRARMAALDLCAVRRRRAGHHRSRLLLDPAEGRDVLVRAQQDPRLAGTCLRGEVGLPLRQSVAVLGDPPSHRRRAPVTDRVAQYRKRETVDLEEEDARSVRPRGRSLAARHAFDHTQHVLVVVVGARDHLEDERDGGHHERGQERVPGAVHVKLIGQRLVRYQQGGSVGDQAQEEARDEREGQPQRGEQRWQHRIDDCDRCRNEDRRGRVQERDPGKQSGRDV